jgi:hypothetical protein
MVNREKRREYRGAGPAPTSDNVRYVQLPSSRFRRRKLGGPATGSGRTTSTRSSSSTRAGDGALSTLAGTACREKLKCRLCGCLSRPASGGRRPAGERVAVHTRPPKKRSRGSGAGPYTSDQDAGVPSPVGVMGAKPQAGGCVGGSVWKESLRRGGHGRFFEDADAAELVVAAVEEFGLGYLLQLLQRGEQ